MLTELKEKREQLIKLLKIEESRINELEKDDKVIEYKELTKAMTENYRDLKALNFQIVLDTMRYCSHIFVTNEIERIWDGHRTDIYEYHGCIKCGLSDHKQWGIQLQQRMESIYEETAKNGIYLEETCNLKLATSIYNGILRAHPNITDELAIKYFKIALHNIRTNNVTPYSRQKRIKRLGLQPSFKNWNAQSVINNY